MRDAGRLGSSPGSRHGCWRVHRVRGSTSNEPSTDLTGGIELTASERPRSSDRITWSIVCRSLHFEQGQDSLGTIRCPRCHLAAVTFTQGLQGWHVCSLPHQPPAERKLQWPSRRIRRPEPNGFSRTRYSVVTRFSVVPSESLACSHGDSSRRRHRCRRAHRHQHHRRASNDPRCLREDSVSGRVAPGTRAFPASGGQSV